MDSILSNMDRFLSVESESMEQSSQEEVSKVALKKPNTSLDSLHPFEEDSTKQMPEAAQSQMIPWRQKRKPDDAFPSSPTEDNQSKSKPASKRKINQKPRRSSQNDQQVRQPHQELRRSSLDEQHPRELPYETSSPKKQASPPKSPAQQQKSNVSRAQPPSPMSSVQMLDKGKCVKTRTQPPKSDNQHMPTRSNCGCNASIRELMVVKNQPVGPKAVFSKEFKELVQKMKLPHYAGQPPPVLQM